MARAKEACLQAAFVAGFKKQPGFKHVAAVLIRIPKVKVRGAIGPWMLGAGGMFVGAHDIRVLHLLHESSLWQVIDFLTQRALLEDFQDLCCKAAFKNSLSRVCTLQLAALQTCASYAPACKGERRQIGDGGLLASMTLAWKTIGKGRIAFR